MTYTKESKLEDLLNDPAGMEVAAKVIPGRLDNPLIGMVKHMTLEKVASYPQAGLDKEDLDKLITALNAQ